MWALGGQESGGLSTKERYSVVNAWGAVGKYQVLKSNIPGWSKEILGYSISWQTFRDSPELQEKIVQGKLRKYFNAWGPRGAAAAWYAGPGNHDLHMNTGKQPGGPSIKGYVDSVLKRAGGYTGQKSAYSSGGTGGGGKVAKEDPKATAEDYGYVIGLINSNSELKKLFKKAVDKGWAPEKFQAELRDTKWWKSHSQQERDYLVKKYGDPATAKQEYNQAYIHVRQLAASLGIVETKSNLAKMKTWAYNVSAKGWSDDQLRYEIGKYVSFKGDTWQGQGGEVQEQLHEYAYSMGVKMSADWYADKSRAVLRGTATVQDYESEIRKQAKALFPQWSKQLDAGQTVLDLASPYMTSMAQILELPTGSLNLFDPTIKKALQFKDKAGVGTAKPLWQFENELRSDPRWKKTQNAQNSLMQVAHQVLSDFGLKY